MIGGQRPAGKTAGEAGRRRRAGRLAALGFVALLAAALPAAGQGATGGDAGGVVAEQIRQSPAEVRDYWTRERMREAQPRDMAIAPDQQKSRAVSPAADPTGVPTFVPGTGPGVPDTGAGLVDGAIGAGGPQTRAAENVSGSNTDFPQRVHGKVFITISGGSEAGDYECSGTAIRSPGHALVFTAGHCVNDDAIGGGTVTNFEFVPGYENGAKPFGEWVARELLTTSGFATSADFRYDVGAAEMRRDANGRGVQDVVGGSGIAFNQARDQFYRAFGYPAELPFNGEELFRCDSDYLGADEFFDPPQPIRIACDMTAGSSGGSWIVDDQFAASVTSYFYQLDPDCPEGAVGECLYGPYFGGAIKQLYKKAGGEKRRCSGAEVTNLGSGGSDEFEGTAGKDAFKLRGRGDRAKGRGDRDRACGGKGGDRLLGEDGDDILKGGKGKDFLDGGSGFDVCKGGKGRDRARDCEERKKIRG